MGYKAQGVIDGLVAADPQHEYRQLGVIDADGYAAARTGHEQSRLGRAIMSPRNLIALGNVLKGEHVLDAIEAGFGADPNAAFEERLMQALEARSRCRRPTRRSELGGHPRQP